MTLAFSSRVISISQICRKCCAWPARWSSCRPSWRLRLLGHHDVAALLLGVGLLDGERCSGKDRERRACQGSHCGVWSCPHSSPSVAGWVVSSRSPAPPGRAGAVGGEFQVGVPDLPEIAVLMLAHGIGQLLQRPAETGAGIATWPSAPRRRARRRRSPRRGRRW